MSDEPAWTMDGPPAPETTFSGKPFLYFAGTGYLGLQADPRLIASAAEAVRRYGIHTATTRSGFGNSPPVLEVERRTAELLAAERACYLASGYAGNQAIAAAVRHAVDLVAIDEAGHDCLCEAARWFDRLSCPPLKFRHRDAGHLAELLARHLKPGERPLVMTDGVFAVSGSIAPVTEYLAVLNRYDGATLLVDDAHGLAVLGAQGRGTLEFAGITPAAINEGETPDGGPRIYCSTTLSKAVGGHGGAIAGSAVFLERVRRASGWFRGASAPAAPVAAATARALEIVQGEPALRQRLAANVASLRGQLRALGLAIDDAPTPIVSFMLGDAEQMSGVQQRLLDAGIAIAFARDYSGAPPHGMLRIAVFATHTAEMIRRLVETLARVL